MRPALLALAAAALLALAAAALLAPAAAGAAEDARLTRIANGIGPRTGLSVHCTPQRDIPGGGHVHVLRASGRIALSGWYCDRLHGFAARPAQRRVEVARAAYTLAGASWHLAGFSRPALKGCYALQTVHLVYRRLGAPPRLARERQLLTLRLFPPADRECRNGGAYDLSPRSGRWP